MNSSDENFSGISIEEALRLLEESKQKQRLLEKRIRELQSQSMTERLLTSKLPAKENPSSDIGPFSISQTTSETIVIRGIDNDDCENFLQDYLGQGEQRSNRRETQPKSKLIINGRTVPINLSLPDGLDVNTKVTYDVERQELRFEIIKGKARKDRVQPFKTYLTDQLGHFVNSNYDIGTSFKPQLYAQGKVVEFEVEEEISGNITENTTTPSLAVVSATELPSIEATEKTSERKRAGSGSTDSEPQKGSIVGTNFYVKTMVNPKTAGLSFAVSTLRPDTYLGRQQGAHITAYIVFVTAILETVDEQDITDIPDLLVAAAMQFVPSSQWESFQDALHGLIKENPFFEKKERKRLTADLRETVQETTVQFIKKSVKIHYAVVLAHFIDDLSNQILMAINQSESTLYARAGRPKTRQELGKEGAKVRNAMKALRKISAELSAESTTSLIEQFSFFSVVDSVEATESVGEERVATFRARTQRGTPSSGGTTMELSDKIATHIFELFDFDYYEYTSSAILSKIESYILEKMQDLEARLPKRKKGARLNEEQAKALSKINDCKVALENLREIEELETSEERLQALEITDFALMNKEIQIRINEVKEDIRQEAPKIITQHLDIIMSHAFPELKRLPKAALDAVCKKFTVMVESRFHWDQMPEIIETALALQLTPLCAIGEKSSDEEEDVDTVVLKQFGNP